MEKACDTDDDFCKITFGKEIVYKQKNRKLIHEGKKWNAWIISWQSIFTGFFGLYQGFSC